MKSKFFAALATIALISSGSAALAVPGKNKGVSAAGGVAKVTICHIPPGNPGNAHLITVASKAALRHIQLHGDFVACPTCPCPPAREEEPVCPPATPTPTPQPECPQEQYGGCPNW